MNITQNTPVSEQKIHISDWTSGPIVSRHKRQGLDHSGTEMKVVAMEMFMLEVFPPREVAKHMEQPAPDISHHLKDEGVDIEHLHRRFVSFMAHVSLPLNPEDSGAEITLKSEQRQNGGIYEQEIRVPEDMICVRGTVQETVLASLNNALHNHRWYPPY